MLKTPFLIALTLAIAFGLGAGSAWWALDRFDGLSTLVVGEWSAQPFAGTPDADPYSRAQAARSASLPLGHAEGIAFVATRDAAGDRLSRDCAYTLSGALPPARFYTLHARGVDGAIIPTGSLRVPALHSLTLLRGADGAARIVVGPDAAAGNWLPVTGSGALDLVLTLYDTPVVSSVSIGEVKLPKIERGQCRG